MSDPQQAGEESPAGAAQPEPPPPVASPPKAQLYQKRVLKKGNKQDFPKARKIGANYAQRLCAQPACTVTKTERECSPSSSLHAP